MDATERDLRNIAALIPPETAPPKALAMTFSDGFTGRPGPLFGRASHLASVCREMWVSL